MFSNLSTIRNCEYDLFTRANHQSSFDERSRRAALNLCTHSFSFGSKRALRIFVSDSDSVPHQSVVAVADCLLPQISHPIVAELETAPMLRHNWSY